MSNEVNEVVLTPEQEIEKLEAEIVAQEAKQVEINAKKELETIAKYGPGTKFNRQIVVGSLDYDAESKKYFVMQTCPISNVVFKTYTSDLFQKGVAPEIAKEQRAKNRKTKAKPASIADAKARLEALKAKQTENASA